MTVLLALVRDCWSAPSDLFRPVLFVWDALVEGPARVDPVALTDVFSRLFGGGPTSPVC